MLWERVSGVQFGPGIGEETKFSGNVGHHSSDHHSIKKSQEQITQLQADNERFAGK